ncbi:ubiquinol-cytochrome c reductase core subunit 10 QCR10 [Phycomyces blakesleeanus NRRL 1555(-)]|uniref:Ubiquinol-cytochrome c reductase core subunit 10 QCR10 n=1 Tax=Phycomyces blakesleeanus (strain ATCC 8743b / DSM 1359 / FGSC 10004 / NBRC 33097 / NRRL 1555) TaxID=763407 RepID=A0A163AMG3_PHYB8|nr:ubiquinol-cytochrome c reductase core subunit 10 QCR10 [Phycomyces blakesleeanus NRRL 1555(-)]OAD74511.1 ubiquinol-cytochrome c reductase core subunit 10 QCR10 [Phycomyces blakesleeanus NRRL 1555(-)]|eukprot:XP_018292551.1 ubiquinol-cytochrome c reductase core subunit 10 QCR10 [Phycomyces blakesleeanus NRRL 1555(-)]
MVQYAYRNEPPSCDCADGALAATNQSLFPSLAIWGIAGAAAFSLLGSDVPIVQKDVLSKVPFVGGYWFVSGKDLEE